MARATRAALLLSAALAFGGCGPVPTPGELAPLPLGGDFTLVGSDGKPFELSQLRGRAVLLFFGFTLCPDVCPTTLGHLARVYRLLEEKKLADRVAAVFVSVDPERDTPQKLAEYLSYFAVPATGVTGSPEEVAAVARLFGASYEKVKVDSAAGYLVEHSAYLYLIDPTGRVRHLFPFGEAPERIADLTARVVRDCRVHGQAKGT